MKPLSKKVRARLVREIHKDVICSMDANLTGFETGYDFPHYDIKDDDIPAANALLTKWRKAFRKWVKEAIR